VDFAIGHRKFVIALFVSITIFLSSDYLHLGAQSRENAFESEYDSPADQVIYAFEGNVGSMFVGLDSLSVAATSHAVDSNSTWAFVTINDFHFVGSDTMALTETSRVSFNPLVIEESRERWEECFRQCGLGMASSGT
jgi:hypothetical protein